MSNEFVKIQKNVRTIVSMYEEFRKKFKIESKGESESIQNLSRPFLKGNFTLAVIGKMSAGKSTFINALLKKRNLLATGFNQTTCTLTEIIHSETEYYEVIFADGESKRFDTVDELQKYTSIPEEFDGFPITHINKAIAEGKNIDDILKNKDVLSEKMGSPIDEGKLREYCRLHTKSNIPELVRVYVKMPDSFQGWKIIDTPGIGAMGGIEDETYNLLNSKDETNRNNLIDAVIFVNSAKEQIESRTFRDFVDETIDKLDHKVRDRTFLVRTYGSDRDYLDNKEQQDGQVQKLFVEGLGLNKERIYTVDSLSSLLLDYTNENKLDLTSIGMDHIPEGFSDKEWRLFVNICRDAKYRISDNKIDLSQESLLNMLSSWANFDTLSRALNEFTRSEKGKSYEQISNLIISDLQAYLKELKKNIANLSKNKGDISALRENLKKEKEKGELAKKQLNDVLNTIRLKYNRTAINAFFKDIENDVKRISGDVSKMSLTMRKHMESVNEIRDNILKKLADDIGASTKEILEKSNIVMPNIDFVSIKEKAKKEATKEVVVGYNKKTVKKGGFLGSFTRLISLGMFGYEEVDDLSKPIKKIKTDEAEAVNRFKTQALKLFNDGVENLKKHLGLELDELGKKSQEEFSKEIKEINIRHENLLKEYEKAEAQESFIKKLEGYFEDVNIIIRNIYQIQS